MPTLKGRELERAVKTISLAAPILGAKAYEARKASKTEVARWLRPAEAPAPRVQPAWLRDIERKESLRREKLRLWRAAGCQAPERPRFRLNPNDRRVKADPRTQVDAKPKKNFNSGFAQADPRWRNVPDVTLESSAPSGPYGETRKFQAR